MAYELPAEGPHKMRILDGSSGLDDKGLFTVRVSVVISDGPDKGKAANYANKVDNKTGKYVRNDMLAIGWKGIHVDTFTSDVQEWIANGSGIVTGEIKHFARKDGSGFFALVSSIGRGAKPLQTPTIQAVKDANDALRGDCSDDAPLPF